tara:strand:- start:1863 stop:2132 length:270 start_codon:yes stop_codon:yes gene_type:complete
MITANQLYKSSGSQLDFKEWLKREQLKGNLNVNTKKQFLNADGDNTATDTSGDIIPMMPTKEAKRNRNFAFVLGLALGFGIKYYMNKRT